MCRCRPGVALVFALALGAASEAWGQQLVSGGNAADRTAHDQFLHEGDVIHLEDVFYSCVGGDLAAPTLFFIIPTGAGSPNVSFVSTDINGNPVGTPTALWDISGGAPNLLGPGAPSFVLPSPPPALQAIKQVNIPISSNFLGAAYRFFLQNLWVKADVPSGSSGAPVAGPSTGRFTGTNGRIDASSITVVDGATATIPSATLFPGTTVGAGNLVINESSTPGQGGIWQNSAGNYGLRIQIPSGYGVTWDPSVTTIGNGGNAHVSTSVTYSGDNLTAFVTVITSFGPSESVTISGLQFVVDPAAQDTDPVTHLPFKLNILEGQSANTFAQCVVNAAGTGFSIQGVPRLDSTANQVFTVGDPSTAIGDIVITDAEGTQKIKSGNTLNLIIPASLNLQWDPLAAPTFVTPMTLGAVSFSLDGKTMSIPVTTNTGSGNTLRIQNAHFTAFSAPNAAGVALQLQYDSIHPAINDSKTNAIGMPTITSANDQVFVVSQGITTLQQITIQDDATNPRIKNGATFAIEIPAGLNLVFTGTPPTLSGNLTGGAVSFSSGSAGNWKRINLTPTVDFGASGTGAVSNLEINVGGPNSIGSLALIMAPAGGTACSTDPRILVIGSFPTMSSSSAQQFTVNDPSTPIATVAISTNAGSAPLFQNGNSLQLIIPNTLLAEWNPAPASASLGGTASGKVNFAGITYPPSGGLRKILQLPITANWTAGDTLSFIGFEMTNFSAACAGVGTSLQLRVSVGGSIAATDANAKAIGQPILTSSPPNQAFGQGDPSTLANRITVSDDPVTPRILGGFEVRIRIPSGFPMTWDNTVVPAPVFTVAGTGTLGTFATAAQYYYTNPQGDQVLRIPVTGSFSPGQAFQISNVRFQNFASVHPSTHLALEVNNNQGVANAVDATHTVVIGTRPQISSITTQDQDSNGSIDHVIVTLDRALDPASSSIATGAGFTVAGYPIVSGNLDLSHQVITYTVLESGLADTGVTPSVTYDATVGSVLEAADDLALQSTAATAADKAAPVIVNFTTTDTDGNGHLDKMTFTFSEPLTGTPNIAQWTVIDADGTTNLLAGLTSASLQVINQGPVGQLVITFSNTIGTDGTPRFRYTSTGAPGTLGDSSTPPNLVATTTNNHPPVAHPGQARSLFPTVVSLDGSASSDADGQPLTYAWSFLGFVPAAGVVPPAPGVTIVNATSPVATTLLNTAGVYTFQLAVSDGLATTTATVAITILNVPPSAHAGPDQSCPLGFFIALDGSLSTDSNGIGDIQSMVWNLVTGPPGATPLVNVTQPLGSPWVAYVVNVAGTHEFELTVTDRAGNVSKDRCFARGQPEAIPVAVAGPSQTVLVNQQVTLDGRSSISAGGALTYLWTSTNNPADPVGPLDLPTVTTSQATFTPRGPGVYTFQLVVSNGAVSSVPDSISVLAYDPSNLSPTAVANLLLPVGVPVVGDTIQLDATGSADPEGAPLKYAWTQTRGPLVSLANPTSFRPSFVAPVSGFYEFRLTVNDGVQSSFPVKTGFNVVANAGSAIPSGTVAVTSPIALGSPFTITPSYTIAPVFYELTQTAGPSIDGFRWNNSWGPSTLSFASSPNPTLPGAYRFDLSLWDNSQVLTVIPITVIVNASAINVVPTANATASPPVTQVGQTVTLSAGGSSASAVRYVWSQVSGPIVALSSSTAVQPTFVPPAAGVYVFSLKVNDGTSDSPADLVVVTVNPSAAAPTGGGGGGGGGGCGLGVEQLLILPMLWTAAWLRRRGRRTGNGR